ncbi:hypothetical protein BKA70DRAFT_1297770 [Coprinopsis sp. MPI-PUGE-AT-0042]|nr:hypothetical protein BKA70DRAFT_1297770 [Coprinopsis sp. MPI-PUGE-AT-0042]
MSISRDALVHLDHCMKDTPTVEYSDMLRALLVKSKEAPNQAGTGESLAEQNAIADKDYISLAKGAMDFCNGRSTLCAKMKTSLRNALEEQDEQKRFELLTEALNTIVLAFQSKSIGELKSEQGLIFVVNQSANAAFGDDRPTIAGIDPERLCTLLPTPEAGAARLRTRSRKRQDSSHRLPWRDVWHCWDVKFSLETTPFPSFPFFTPDSISSEALASPSAFRRTRSSLSLSTPPPEISADFAFIAAFNGVELLCSHWDRIHSFGLILEDHWLSFRWYDAEGCIASKAINVISQLPFLAMTVVLLQRFDSRMRGRGNYDFTMQAGGQQVDFDLPADHGAFAALIPRRPVATMPSHNRQNRACPSAVANAGSAQSLAALSFKLSWRIKEEVDETVVISLARERAQYYLPHPEYVINHLPDIQANEDYDMFSTRTSETPSALVMKKLQELDNLDPGGFQRFVWQIIRCVYLLWQVGIAHGDVSFWNMMFSVSDDTTTAVLIDYSHATIMEPGTRSPNRPGFENIGTRPFMAVDVGVDIESAVDPDFKRVFRHDLESALWCIVWYCQPQKRWLINSWGVVVSAKRAWVSHADVNNPPHGIRKGCTELWKCSVQAVKEWLRADYNSEVDPKTDQEWLDILHAHIPCPDEVGTDWMTFRVPQDQIRPEDRDPPL